MEESQEEGSDNSLVGREDTSAAIPDKSASMKSEDNSNLDGVKSIH